MRELGKKCLLGIVVAGLGWGCGSSADLSTISGGVPFNSTTASTVTSAISGRVLSETGAPLEGVQVIVHERTTDLRTRTLSGPNGEFQLQVASGVYDLGLESKADPTKANCFFGPITVASAVQRDFVMRNTQGHATDEVFGKIWLTPGVPAVNRQITLRPGAQLRGSGLTRLGSPSTRTGPDGSFALGVGSNLEVALDVEIFDNAGLDEWVDVAKRAKACYVEFSSEESSVENRLHCTERDPATYSLAAAVLPKDGTEIIPFAIRENKGTNYAVLKEGLIPVGAPKTLLSEMMFNGPLDETPLWRMTKHTPIEVTNRSNWGYDYSVEIKPDRSSDWAFTDKTGDTYQLWVSITLWSHVVGYDSSDPAINRIDFDLSSI